MKRIISLLLTVTLLASCMPAQAWADMLKLPAALRTIAAEAFQGTDSLNIVDVPYGTETIESRAFADSGLSRIYIPSTVYYIAGDAFDDDVVILSPPNSYARRYASLYGLNWLDCGNHYPQEGQQPTEEDDPDGDAEPLTPDDLFTGDWEYLSEEGLEADEEVLAAAREYNLSIDQVIAAEEQYNESMQTLLDEINGLADALSQCSFTETNGAARFAFGAGSLTVDAGFANAASFSFTGVSMTEDGSALLSASNGQTFALTVSGGSASIMPASGGHGVTAKDVPSAPPPDAAWQQIADRANNLMIIIDALSEGLAYVLRDAEELVNRTKAALNIMRRCHAGIVISDKLSGEAKNGLLNIVQALADKLGANESVLSARQVRIMRWAKGVAAFSVVANAFILTNLWVRYMQLQEIRQHGHPTENDLLFYASNVNAEELVRRCDLLQNLYYLDALDCFTSLCVNAATVFGAEMMSFFNPAFSVAFWVVHSALSLGINAWEEQEWNRIKELDGQLHQGVLAEVKDADTGEALADVRVSLDGKSALGFTDENGKFAICLPTNTNSLLFFLDEYDTTLKTFTLVPNGELYLPVDMKRSAVYGDIQGRVLDAADGRPLSGATVTCGEETVTTDTDGAFSFHMILGTYDMEVRLVGYGSQYRSVPLIEGVTEIDFHMEVAAAIHNREELAVIGNNPYQSYYLANDIDLSDAPWTPISFFYGKLDGNGHAITGMTVDEYNNNGEGLFSCLSGAYVHDLTIIIAEINLSRANQAGILAGNILSKSRVKDCHVSGVFTIGYASQVGGIGGSVNNSTIENCTSNVSMFINGNGNYGGIMGFGANITMTESYANIHFQVHVTDTNVSVCGLGCANSSSKITDCSADGDINIESTGKKTGNTVYAKGIQYVRNGYNFVTINALSEASSITAVGCDGGENCYNGADISLETSYGGYLTVYGLQYVKGGLNVGAISAVSTNLDDIMCGEAKAAGAYGASGKVTNKGNVYAENTVGTATAIGIDGGSDSKNTGNIEARSGTGALLPKHLNGGRPSATGIRNAGRSVNTGKITTISNGCDAFACGLLGCSNGENYGTVTAMRYGEHGMPLKNTNYDNYSECEAYGLKDCYGCANYASVRAESKMHEGKCYAYGSLEGADNYSSGFVVARGKETSIAYGNSTGPNYGAVYAFGDTADARGAGGSNYAGVYAYGNTSGEARGSKGQFCENEGDVYACGDRATACGVFCGKDGCSVNRGSVTAEGRYYAYAYGYTSSGNSSTGHVSASITEILFATYGVFPTWRYPVNSLWAYNSTSTTVTAMGCSVSSNGGDMAYLYYLVPRPQCGVHRNVEEGAYSDADDCYYMHDYPCRFIIGEAGVRK